MKKKLILLGGGGQLGGLLRSGAVPHQRRGNVGDGCGQIVLKLFGKAFPDFRLVCIRRRPCTGGQEKRRYYEHEGPEQTHARSDNITGKEMQSGNYPGYLLAFRGVCQPLLLSGFGFLCFQSSVN